MFKKLTIKDDGGMLREIYVNMNQVFTVTEVEIAGEIAGPFGSPTGTKKTMLVVVGGGKIIVEEGLENVVSEK